MYSFVTNDIVGLRRGLSRRTRPAAALDELEEAWEADHDRCARFASFDERAASTSLLGGRGGC